MKRKALAAFLLSLVVLAIPTDAQRRRKRSRRTTPKTFSSESYSTRTITERITPDAFVVAPGKLMYFPVSLPQSAAWGMITGRFRAQGVTAMILKCMFSTLMDLRTTSMDIPCLRFTILDG
jgi:hypothetical protein